MGRYILKRVLSAILTIWVIMTITFFLMHAIPGDPFTMEKMPNDNVRQAMMAQYGLDKPLYVQYFKYISDFVQGNFGVSYQRTGYTTNMIIEAGFPYSLKIGLYASALVIVLGISFGIISAMRQNKLIDRVLMIVATLGSTIPSFVLATGFLFLFSKTLGLVPSFGVDSWKGYIGPVLIIGVFSLAFITRLTRTSILDVMNQDYIRTARAKGLTEGVVIRDHVLRNAMIPVVTYIGPMIAGIVTGSFVIEKVFGIPGIGSLFTTSILTRDYTLIMGVTVFFAIFLVISLLAVDLAYVLIDPRIKLQ